jgi:hypothetical protein
MMKVKLSLCLIKNQAMKMDGGEEVYICAFLMSALDRGEWSASGLGHIIPEE